MKSRKAPKKPLSAEGKKKTAPSRRCVTTKASAKVKPPTKAPARPAAGKKGFAAPAKRRRGARPAAPDQQLAAAALAAAAFPGGWTWDPRYPGDDAIATGEVDTEFDRYTGLYDGTLRRYAAAGDGPGAVSYATKFTVDGDGSGGQQPGDDEYDPNTSLHYHDGHAASTANALNALIYSFAVIPLPSANFPDFADLGFGLGDLGVAFFGRGSAAAFIYGDFGPRRKVGEGSVKMAKLLSMDWPDEMNSSPASGGFTAGEMSRYAPGVLHIAFPGSRDRDDEMTDLLTQAQVAAAAWAPFDRWVVRFNP